MISAFELYLILQLDSIGSTLAAASIIGAVISLFGSVGSYACQYEAGDMSEPVSEKTGSEQAAFNLYKILKPCRTMLVACLFGILCTSLLPSTKTAAAMWLVPALTSDKVVELVTPEAKEIYDLAKQALQNLADPEKSDESKGK